MLSQNAAITDAAIPEDEKSKIKKKHKKYGGYCYEKINKQKTTKTHSYKIKKKQYEELKNQNKIKT